MKYDVIRKYTEEFSVTDIDYHCTHRSSIYRVKITGSEFCHVVSLNLLGRCKCNLHYNMTTQHDNTCPVLYLHPLKNSKFTT